MKAQLESSRSSKVALLTALFFLAAVAQLSAQSSIDLSTLQKHINKQVTVETEDGQVTGQLLRVEESRLVVYEASTPRSIPRDSVKKVTRHSSRHTVAWVAGMSAAGLVSGFLLGFHAFDDATNAERKIPTTALVGAGAGATAGYALSRIGKSDKVVYQHE